MQSARTPWRAPASALALAALAACTARDTGPLPPRDAARWLYAACGIRFAQDPVVLKSSSTAAGARAGAPVSVTATVVLPDAEIAPALAALRQNRSLHRRGQSETRYGYESFPDATPERECELDTALHVLYFRYAGAGLGSTAPATVPHQPME